METQNTAKNFVLQLGSLIAMYVSITSLLVILFGIITLSFPDAADGYWKYESATESIRFSIAVLIVFFPTYIILTRMVNNIRRREHGTYLALTKWLIYLSLLFGGGILLGDLVVVINEFLNGEITIRFLLKALSMLVVIGTAFIYYLLDVKEYWREHEQGSVWYGVCVSIFVGIVLIMGFLHIEMPSEVREKKLDALQIIHLNEIQWQIAEHYDVTGKFPVTLEEAYKNQPVPEAPEGRTPYEYNTIEVSFELCAEFAQKSWDYEQKPYRPDFVFQEKSVIKNPHDWYHTEGMNCFERFVY